jgi:protein-disulfide isomerase
MTTHACPICADGFESDGTLRDHMWGQHRACHYCETQFSDDDAESVLYKHWLAVHPDDLAQVDYKRAESVVDEITFSDRLSARGVGPAVANLPRRYILVAGGATATAGIAGATAYLNSQAEGERPGANPVDEYEYATLGSKNAGTSITYYGSYKCPFCAEFSTGLLQELIREYVDPGNLAITYRNLSYFNGKPFLGPDAPNAGHAGLAVYNTGPASYRDFHEYVFRNQPPESQQWATADRLTMFAREAGVTEPSVVRTAIRERRYKNALQETESAANTNGLRGTPALVVDGMSFNPLSDPEQTRQIIEDAIDAN